MGAACVCALRRYRWVFGPARPRYAQASTGQGHLRCAGQGNQTLDRLRTILRTQALADALNDVVVNDGYRGITVLNSSTGPSSSFVADLAIVGGGVAGGGVDYKDVEVRVCVRYSGRLGVDPHVDMADVTCPAGLPSTHYGLPIERTVTLK